jgi:hypothetical protein
MKKQKVIDFAAGAERKAQKDEDARYEKEVAAAFAKWLSQQLPRARKHLRNLEAEALHVRREIAALEDGREFSDIADLVAMLDDDRMLKADYMDGVSRALDVSLPVAPQITGPDRKG